MKQRIRINESQLRRIVSESVKGCLNEVFFVFLSIESILGSGRKVANAICAIRNIVSIFFLEVGERLQALFVLLCIWCRDLFNAKGFNDFNAIWRNVIQSKHVPVIHRIHKEFRLKLLVQTET